VEVWVADGFGEMAIVSVTVDRVRWHAPNKNPNTNTRHDEINKVWYFRMTQPAWLDLFSAY
jgi:hypothetical protein